MARVCGACCGLLVFSAMIVCGVLAGNPVQTTVLRALVGLFGGYALGCLCGWIGVCVVNENAAADRDASGTPDQARQTPASSTPAPRREA